MTAAGLSRSFRALIIGAPASGKGTISSKIVKKFDFQHISSGDLLRWNIEKNTEAGQKADAFVKTGKLVPDNLIIDCMFDKIKQEPHPKILLDGFPRVSSSSIHKNILSSCFYTFFLADPWSSFGSGEGQIQLSCHSAPGRALRYNH